MGSILQVSFYKDGNNALRGRWNPALLKFIAKIYPYAYKQRAIWVYRQKTLEFRNKTQITLFENQFVCSKY